MTHTLEQGGAQGIEYTRNATYRVKKSMTFRVNTQIIQKFTLYVLCISSEDISSENVTHLE